MQTSFPSEDRHMSERWLTLCNTPQSTDLSYLDSTVDNFQGSKEPNTFSRRFSKRRFTQAAFSDSMKSFTPSATSTPRKLTKNQCLRQVTWCPLFSCGPLFCWFKGNYLFLSERRCSYAPGACSETSNPKTKDSTSFFQIICQVDSKSKWKD